MVLKCLMKPIKHVNAQLICLLKLDKNALYVENCNNMTYNYKNVETVQNMKYLIMKIVSVNAMNHSNKTLF